MARIEHFGALVTHIEDEKGSPTGHKPARSWGETGVFQERGFSYPRSRSLSSLAIGPGVSERGRLKAALPTRRLESRRSSRPSNGGQECPPSWHSCVFLRKGNQDRGRSGEDWTWSGCANPKRLLPPETFLRQITPLPHRSNYQGFRRLLFTLFSLLFPFSSDFRPGRRDSPGFRCLRFRF